MSWAIMMDLPWIIGIFLSIAYFAFWEYAAFQHPNRTNTLSHFIYTIGSQFPLSIFIMGLFVGCLATHFFWHWDPNCIQWLPGTIQGVG